MQDPRQDEYQYQGNEQSDVPEEARRARPKTTPLFLLIVTVLIIALMLLSDSGPKQSTIPWGFFITQFNEKNIETATMQGMRLTGTFKTPPKFSADPDKEEPEELHEHFITEVPPFALSDPSLDEQFRKQLGDNYAAKEVPDHTAWLLVFYVVISGVLFLGVWMMIRRTREQMMGGNVLPGFSKSPAKRYQIGDKRITFEDVAGVDSVKAELEELVDYLKNPTKFARMGARVPKGVLMMGPPGTGKTLLARAVAGEAGVPFFSVNGSEFIQMFVGVGASRVRDLFNTAKAHSPAILFIDEIDAVGRHRGTGVGGGHDEREQTLNQILSEMDGFLPTQSVIVIAATNRPDVLDPALLRPGRFDRHITVDRPTLKGRLAIFKVHSRDIPLSDDVDLERLAAGTVGLTGADISNLVNEATLWATRQDREVVTMDDFNYAREKISFGTKREEILTEQEKLSTAYHEVGHTLLAWFEPLNDRVHKVTIIPRGRALGATYVLPDEDQVSISKSQLRAKLAFMLGGRAAEKLIFDERSAGAENDLQQASGIARQMVMRWGMSEELGPVSFRIGEHSPFLGKEMGESRQYSERTAQLIDEEVSRILHEAEQRAMDLLVKYREQLDLLANQLAEQEELNEEQIVELIGPGIYEPRVKISIGGADRPEKGDGEPEDAKPDEES